MTSYTRFLTQTWKLLAGRHTNRGSISGKGKIVFLLQGIQTDSGALPGSCSVGTGGFFLRE